MLTAQSAFKQFNDALDDLDLIGEVDINVLHRLRYLGFKLKKSKSQHIENESFSQLHDYFRDILNFKIEATLKKSGVSSLRSFYSCSEFSFATWDRLLSVFDDLSDVIECFDFKKECSFEINNDYLIFHGPFDMEKWSPDTKRRVYSFTKTLLAKQSLLTYQYSKKSGEHFMTLVLDISHRADEFTSFAARDEGKPGLLFSGILENYSVSEDTLSQLDKHMSIEVRDDYSVVKRDHIPQEYKENYRETSFEKSIFYFPFLFRPLSLIIPFKGERLKISDFQPQPHYSSQISLRDTGSVNGNTKPWLFKQEAEGNSYFLDFFQLFFP